MASLHAKQCYRRKNHALNISSKVRYFFLTNAHRSLPFALLTHWGRVTHTWARLGHSTMSAAITDDEIVSCTIGNNLAWYLSRNRVSYWRKNALQTYCLQNVDYVICRPIAWSACWSEYKSTISIFTEQIFVTLVLGVEVSYLIYLRSVHINSFNYPKC